MRTGWMARLRISWMPGSAGSACCEVLWHTTDTVNQGLITAPRATKFAHPVQLRFR